MNTRSTIRQQEILRFLSGSDFYTEVGPQPYRPSDIAYLIDSSADQNKLTTSVRRTLQLLAKKGLVRVDRKKADVYTGLGVISRDLDHYWNVSTEKKDAALSKKWRDDSEKRSLDALDRMFGTGINHNENILDVN